MVKSAIQGLVMFFGIQFVMGKFMGSGKATTTTTTDASGTVVTVPANTAEIPPYYARPDHLDEGAVYNPLAQRIAPIWPLDSLLDITIVVSPTFVSEPLAKTPKERIVVDEVAFKLGDYKENRVIDTTFPVPKEVQNNGTLWAHFYIGLTGSKLDPSTPGYNPERAFHFIHPLTQYIAQKKIKKTKNLLAAVNETEEVRFVLRDYERGVDRSVARGSYPSWTNHQISLSSELHHVFHPRFWSHALSLSSTCRQTVHPYGSNWRSRRYWAKWMVLPSAVCQHLLAAPNSYDNSQLNGYNPSAPHQPESLGQLEVQLDGKSR
jgi:hypothetical protein